MKQNIVHAVIVLLIVAFLGASLMMIVPVEDANAWPVHLSNCRWEVISGSGGGGLAYVCDAEYHSHIWKH